MDSLCGIYAIINAGRDAWKRVSSGRKLKGQNLFDHRVLDSDRRRKLGHVVHGGMGIGPMVMSMALDLADKGVLVSAICLGFVDMPLALEVVKVEADPEAASWAKRLIYLFPRAGKPQEIGALAVYLVSDLSAFLTAQAIAIDGECTVR